MEIELNINDLSDDKKEAIQNRFFDRVMDAINKDSFANNIEKSLEDKSDRMIEWLIEEVPLERAIKALEVKVEQAIKRS